jgi:uncharacterized membrane protein
MDCEDGVCGDTQFEESGGHGVVIINAFGSATATPGIGRVGQGMIFDGSESVVAVATSSGMTVLRNISAGSFAGWIKADDFSVGVHQTIVSVARGATDTTARFEIQAVGTSTTAAVVRLAARAGDSESIQYATTTNAVLTEGRWHHIVGVVNYASDTFTLYIDGSSVTLNISPSFTASASSNTAPNHVEFGRHDSATTTPNFFDGTMDDVRIYNSALSASDVQRLYHLGATTNINTTVAVGGDMSNNFIGHWTFDGPRMYPNIVDSSPAGNSAYWSDFRGAPAATTTTVGKLGQALLLDGTNNYVTVGDVNAVDSATALSSCAWVNHTTINNDDIIIEKETAANLAGFVFFRDDSGATSGRTDTYSIQVDDASDTDTARLEGATNASSLSTWTHVCFTYQANSATGLRLYVNGVEDANSPVSVSTIGSISSGTESMTIGSDSSGSAGVLFNGALDDIRLYTRVLSASEISKIYRLASPRGALGLPFAVDEKSPFVQYALGLYQMPVAFIDAQTARMARYEESKEQTRAALRKSVAWLTSRLSGFAFVAEAQSNSVADKGAAMCVPLPSTIPSALISQSRSPKTESRFLPKL